MKIRTMKAKFAPRLNRVQQVSAGVGLAVLAAMASAEGTDIAAIGTSAAVEIAKFSVMISAIGAAVLSVVVLIQGFVMAFKMTRKAS